MFAVHQIGTDQVKASSFHPEQGVATWVLGSPLIFGPDGRPPSCCGLAEHPEVERSKQLGTLKDAMLQGKPFPRIHAKAAETKALLKPVSDALRHFQDQDLDQRPVLHSIVDVLEVSHDIDVLIDSMTGYRVDPGKGRELTRLVHKLNIGTTKLCHFFHPKGLWLFNFVPKNHNLGSICLPSCLGATRVRI